MRLWWRVAYPIYVIAQDNEDLSDVIWNRDLGEHSYSEPMYQATKYIGSEKELIKSQSGDLNCTICRGYNGSVIYRRKGSDIFHEGDKPYVVDQKIYRATPGNDDLWPSGDVKIGDSIIAKTFSNGAIERQLVK